MNFYRRSNNIGNQIFISNLHYKISVFFVFFVVN